VLRGYGDAGNAAGLVRVLETQRMSDLVQVCQVGIVAQLRGLVAGVRAEPDIAARIVAGIVGIGRRIGDRRLGDADVGAVGAGIFDRQVREGLHLLHGVVHGLLLGSGHLREVRRLQLAAAVDAQVDAHTEQSHRHRRGRHVVGRGVRKAVCDGACPLPPIQKAVDVLIAGG
jgi:hypothetical protein